MNREAWSAAEPNPPLPAAGTEVLCAGEVVWDSLPAGLFLGGAPLNVARHLRSLGVPAVVASRVGADRLGEEVLHRLGAEGLATELVQTDAMLPTGFARITVGPGGAAAFELLRPAAWDAIEVTDSLVERADAAAMIVYGTVAQRSLISRAMIERLWETDAIKVYDANLRGPVGDIESIRRSLGAADVVKVNRDELRHLGDWFGWPGGEEAAARTLADAFSCDTVCVTRGEDGAALLRHGTWTEHPGFDIAVRDTVGAGDAFLAALLRGILEEAPNAELLYRANLHGAWVASREGAVPPYDREAIAQIARRNARPLRVGADLEPRR